MTEIELLRIRVATLTKRVHALEKSVQPLASLEGVDGDLLADQAVVSFAAENIGSTLAEVAGPKRTREATEARRRVAGLLRTRAGWSLSRIARNLNRSDKGVARLLTAQK